jgi:ribonuclease Z
MTTEIFSKGLYSTYLYIKGINCAFDCGEGVSTALGPRCFGIQKIFLSHGHTDHIGGLVPLIGIRSAGFGDKSTPLDIYYPKGCKSVEALIAYTKTMREPSYKLSWIPLEDKSEVDIGNNKKVRSFRVDHTKNSLGFSIIEQRTKLKSEYSGYSGQELKQLRESGVEISQKIEHKLWAYSGDAYKVPTKEIEEADWFFCDSTFLNEDDREEKTHMSLDEAIELAKSAKVKNFVAMHLSPRYSFKEIKEAQVKLSKFFPGNNGKIASRDKMEKFDKVNSTPKVLLPTM